MIVKPNELLRYLFRVEKRSMRDASRRMGRSRDYMSNYVSSGRMPNISVATEICDAIDCDLLVRDRYTGDEIIIDPPKRE